MDSYLSISTPFQNTCHNGGTSTGSTGQSGTGSPFPYFHGNLIWTVTLTNSTLVFLGKGNGFQGQDQVFQNQVLLKSLQKITQCGFPMDTAVKVN
jgi:hypothetical protein